MTVSYKYARHARVEERETEGPVIVHKHRRRRTHRLEKLNNAIGLRITQTVGTMWAAYAFVALTLVSFPAAITSGNPIVIVAWIAQTFLQLVLLPIIIVGQNIQAKASDARSLATYKDAGAILEESNQIQQHLAAQDEAITRILEQVKQLRAEARAELREDVELLTAQKRVSTPRKKS